MASLEDKFVGCLLGLALGDALGAPHEGGIVARSAWRVLGIGKGKTLRWTDDTEMAIVLARSLTEHRGLAVDALARAWAEKADWKRGYGEGAMRLLARIRAGEDWRMANRSVFPTGSYGNGAAMRAAPLGLWFHRDPAQLTEAATLASSITHAHPLGIEGGVLIARATAMAIAGDLDLGALRDGCREAEFRVRLDAARTPMDSATAITSLGNAVVAHESAVTAVHAAARFAEFVPMIDWVISLGGDTDTIGAMAGAIFGARHGIGALPSAALKHLEECPSIRSVARELHATNVAAFGEA
ncbi:MAG TPA: ADP-ribosylglycohydrolase family protein [Planctomycetota bacterium]|nr:ADP-ribosylglycohydrolase family protein [Planctomycetota bacterium]